MPPSSAAPLLPPAPPPLSERPDDTPARRAWVRLVRFVAAEIEAALVTGQPTGTDIDALAFSVVAPFPAVRLLRAWAKDLSSDFSYNSSAANYGANLWSIMLAEPAPDGCWGGTVEDRVAVARWMGAIGAWSAAVDRTDLTDLISGVLSHLWRSAFLAHAANERESDGRNAQRMAPIFSGPVERSVLAGWAIETGAFLNNGPYDLIPIEQPVPANAAAQQAAGRALVALLEAFTSPSPGVTAERAQVAARTAAGGDAVAGFLIWAAALQEDFVQGALPDGVAADVVAALPAHFVQRVRPSVCFVCFEEDLGSASDGMNVAHAQERMLRMLEAAADRRVLQDHAIDGNGDAAVGRRRAL